MRILAVALLCCAATPAVEAHLDVQQYDPRANASQRGGMSPTTECQLMGNVFYRLAELRRDGAGQKNAITTVDNWLESVGGTGTHLVANQSERVSAAAAIVFSQRALSSTSLGHFGFGFCRLQTEFADDAPRQQAAFVMLLNAAEGCQKKFPGEAYSPSLGTCIEEETVRLSDYVHSARIKVK